MAITNTQRVIIDLNQRTGCNTIRMKQYDKNTRIIEVVLTDGVNAFVIPETAIVKFQATKSDKTIIFDNCTVIENVIGYTATEQLTAVSGIVLCEIGIYETISDVDYLIQSATFNILVEKSAMDRNAVVSSSEFNALTGMVASIDGFSTALATKIRTATYTATATRTNIVHNLEFNPVHDDLLAIYSGMILTEGSNYTNNANTISIDLLDWSIASGESIFFKVYKNVK